MIKIMERSEYTTNDVRKEAFEAGRPMGLCYMPSTKYEELIEEYGGDFRAALGAQAIQESHSIKGPEQGSFVPSWDERRSF